MDVKVWEVTVFVESDSGTIYYVDVEAEIAEEAVRVAMAQTREALAVITPTAKVVGGRARRKSDEKR